MKQGNLLSEEWSGSDFVYMANPFEYDMLEKVATIASLMKVGSWFVTLFKPLPESEKWQMLMCRYMEMSWG